jgi:hypothetical protein
MKNQMEDITVAFKDQIGTLKHAIEKQDQNMRTEVDRLIGIQRRNE